MQWKSIDSAPKDGRPVWVKKIESINKCSCLWVYWDKNVWRDPSNGMIITYHDAWLDMEASEPLKDDDRPAAILPDGSTVTNVYEAFEAGRRFEESIRGDCQINGWFYRKKRRLIPQEAELKVAKNSQIIVRHANTDYHSLQIAQGMENAGANVFSVVNWNNYIIVFARYNSPVTPILIDKAIEEVVQK